MQEVGAIGDIIFFAIIAAVIWYRLHSALGKGDGDAGFGSSASKQSEGAKTSASVVVLPVEDAQRAPAPKTVPEPTITDEAVAKVISDIKSRDKDFTLASFFQGAEAAFEMVISAFAEGDKQMLGNLLDQELCKEYVAEIDAREGRKEVQDVTVISINNVEVVKASLDKSIAEITLKIDSEQISVVKDKGGKIIEGDASKIEKLEDEWVFRRNLTDRNPNWTIIET